MMVLSPLVYPLEDQELEKITETAISGVMTVAYNCLCCFVQCLHFEESNNIT